jgi:hypothetical protein
MDDGLFKVLSHYGERQMVENNLSPQWPCVKQLNQEIPKFQRSALHWNFAMFSFFSRSNKNKATFRIAKQANFDKLLTSYDVRGFCNLEERGI